MKHERIEGRVRDVVQSGDAVVETAHGVVFVRGALPGERVLISLDGKSGRVQRGRLVSVLEPLAARVESPCAHVVRCGGCPLIHADAALQETLKARFLRDALLKVGAPAELTVSFHGASAKLAYRKRARLHFRGGRARELGYVRDRSHDVVDVSHCAVLVPALDQAHRALREQLLPQLANEGEIMLALGKAGGAVVVLRSKDVQPPAAYATCETLVRSGALEGIAVYAGGATMPARFGEPLEWGEGADGLPLEGTIGGFSQAHGEINRVLALRVAELARTEGMRVLELYAGHGNLTVMLAGGALSYAAVEQDQAAGDALRRNLQARKLSAKVVVGDALRQLGAGPLDVLVLDPPRTGAAGLLTAAAARKPRRIVYVSCDPATLARDVAEALAVGYRIEAAEAFDMFPQTADLESVVCLTR